MEAFDADLSALDRLAGRFRAAADADATPLMQRWCDIIVEQNRRGVLSGLDGNDRPMPALKYRGGAGRKTGNRRVPGYGTALHDATGAGPFAEGLHDNLSPSAYRELTGPRLAPRGEASRVIKNLHTEIRNPAPGVWEAVGAWLDVLSTRGVAFLPFHFDGRGHNPKYDLRPVRPAAVAFARNAMLAWVKEVYLGGF